MGQAPWSCPEAARIVLVGTWVSSLVGYLLLQPVRGPEGTGKGAHSEKPAGSTSEMPRKLPRRAWVGSCGGIDVAYWCVVRRKEPRPVLRLVDPAGEMGTQMAAGYQRKLTVMLRD